MSAVAGNLAAMPQRVPRSRDTSASIAPPERVPHPGDAAASTASPQRSLFPDRPASKVIPFDVLAGGTRPAPRLTAAPVVQAPASPRVAPAPVAQVPPPKPQPAPPPAARPQARRLAPRKVDAQPELDFLPPSVTPRTLRTSVQATIYCDAPVATATHRALAGTVDLCLVLVGYGMCLTAYSLMGGSFPGNRAGYIVFGAAFLFLALFYGALWTLARTETPGMRWTSLRLTNFDGFAPDPGQRILRYFATCLSFATCGFGLLWALVDEESLTWQDHISQTFPTFHGAD